MWNANLCQIYAFFELLSVVAAYHWPSPLFDQIEGLLFEAKQEGGFARRDFLGPIAGCVPGIGTNAAAEWVRFVRPSTIWVFE